MIEALPTLRKEREHVVRQAGTSRQHPLEELREKRVIVSLF